MRRAAAAGQKEREEIIMPKRNKSGVFPLLYCCVVYFQNGVEGAELRRSGDRRLFCSFDLGAKGEKRECTGEKMLQD